jgi:S-DNA-T family DNA segregation ATPase FtsK/SpoIIIE
MGRTIFINNPLDKVKFDPYKVMDPEPVPGVENIREEDDSDLEIYSEKDYFSRAPRIASIIEHEVVKIDAPPNSQDTDNKPLLLVLGSTLSMGTLMVVSSLMSNSRLSTGAGASIIITVIMLMSMMLFPILNMNYDKKLKKGQEKKRQEKYRKYIKSKSDLIDSIIKNQKKILTENYVSADECAKIILSRGPRLWERKIEDKDFLTVNISIGDVQADMDIQYPEEHFT